MTDSQSSPSASAPARLESNLLPPLGILLVAGGLFLLAWFLFLWFKPEPPPYRYQLVEEGGVSEFAKLGLEAWPDLTISKYEVRLDSVDKPIAVAYRAGKGDTTQSVMLNWENEVPEPIGSIGGGKLSELTTLAAALAQYVPKEGIVLAWWDTSRQVRLLTGRDTVFTSHHGQPVIAPSYWKGRLDAIERYEREFWGTPPSAEERQKFQRFVDALAAEAEKGATMLRGLAGDRDAFVIVHVTDLYKLGLMRPDRLDMAFKNFPITGNVHGLVAQVNSWMKTNNYDTVTMQSLSENETRAYFLRGGTNEKPLLTQMFRFKDWTPVELRVLELVYEHGGYWVYKVPPVETSSH